MTSEPVVETLLGVEQSAAGRRWVMRPYDERLALTIAQRHGLPDAVSRILSQRGITTEVVGDYLNPNLAEIMPDPFVLADLEPFPIRSIIYYVIYFTSYIMELHDQNKS